MRIGPRKVALWRTATIAIACCLAACAAPRANSTKMPAGAPAASTATAATAANFNDWLTGVRVQAAAAGISKPTLDSALDNLQPIREVLDLELKQPEVKLTFAQYLDRTVTTQRVAQGQKLLAENRPLLDRVSAAYGVQPQYIVALWGIESDYGRVTGGYPVIGALATLAYGSQRKDMFRTELMDALRILDEKDIQADLMTGSWAGAMGQCQFLPSSFLRYAVDFSGDGRRDIWTDRADVFASTANYLASLQWDRNRSWGREVKLPPGFDSSLIDWESAKPIQEWQRLGVRNPDGSDLQGSSEPVALVASDGVAGRAFLVNPNYSTIMKWNRSTYFATSVGLLADRIAGGVQQSSD